MFFFFTFSLISRYVAARWNFNSIFFSLSISQDTRLQRFSQYCSAYLSPWGFWSTRKLDDGATGRRLSIMPTSSYFSEMDVSVILSHISRNPMNKSKKQFGKCWQEFSLLNGMKLINFFHHRATIQYSFFFRFTKNFRVTKFKIFF